MESRLWLIFVGLAGLCWGTYVPMIAFGGKELKNSYASFMCVGTAYFLIAILFPLGVFWLRGRWPLFNVHGATCATLAGVAGALGALCVILAAAWGGDRRFIGPLIFGTAPVINTVVSFLWHPTSSAPWNFSFPENAPGWKFYVGIVLAGLGAALVLYSKEEIDVKHTAIAARTPAASILSPGQK